jgi:hypothetical protein
MTTAAQIKKLVQPFLKRNPDMVIIGRFVFFKRVDHLLRGIYIDRYSYKEGFRPTWAVDYLFRPIKDYSLGLGEEIYPAPEDQWYIDIPNIDKKFADRMEEMVLPRLHAHKTIEEFSSIKYNLCGQVMMLNRTTSYKLYVDLALGKFDFADKALEIFSKQPEYRSKYFHSPEHYDEMMNVVRPMIQANDKAGIAAKLHEWEAYSVKQLKLEKYWQPSPFPIEM